MQRIFSTDALNRIAQLIEDAADPEITLLAENELLLGDQLSLVDAIRLIPEKRHHRFQPLDDDFPMFVPAVRRRRAAA